MVMIHALFANFVRSFCDEYCKLLCCKTHANRLTWPSRSPPLRATAPPHTPSLLLSNVKSRKTPTATTRRVILVAHTKTATAAAHRKAYGSTRNSRTLKSAATKSSAAGALATLGDADTTTTITAAAVIAGKSHYPASDSLDSAGLHRGGPGPGPGTGKVTHWAQGGRQTKILLETGSRAVSGVDVHGRRRAPCL